jgi:Asp-tRNA(Asn)/Glu-tRNA(Gln) amidotransferase A subunit family amidase
MSLSATRIAAEIRSGARSATSVVEAHLASIDAADADIEAWVTVDRAGALAVAGEMDGRDCSELPLAGVPVGIKDIIDVAGLPTTAGAAAFAHRTPQADARVVEQLKDAGAIVLGKTATTEFAYMAPASTHNPWNLEHTPGGSSSGSAAAVASGMVPVALGSQTIGSVLRPAAFCGVVGFKPSYGAVSTDAVVPLAWSFDHVGVFGRSVEDVASVFDVVAPNAEPATSQADRLARIGLLRGYASDRLSEDLAPHIETLVAGPLAGVAEFSEAEIPTREDWFEAGLVVLSAEAAAYHAKAFAGHEADYREQTATLVRQGLGTSATDYIGARQSLRDLGVSIVAALEGFDALLLPVAPGPAPRGLESTGDSSFCAPASFAGLPSISLPTAVNSQGLPFAIQLVGRRGGDRDLLAMAARFESRLGFTATPPSLAH